MLLKDILQEIEYESVNFQNLETEDIVYDSRKAKSGTLFVCLNGARTDGHSFAPMAYDSGCRAFMVERYLCLPEDAVQIHVSDTRAALANISAVFFRFPSKRMKLIGITGTKGKTTTAHLLKALIEDAGIKCGIIGTIGAQYGNIKIKTVNTTPESYELHKIFREMADNGCKACVMEVSSTGLKTHRVDGIHFDTAVFTNLSPDHIGTNEHPDFADYMYWKSVLFEHCDKAVVNIDDPACDEMLKNSKAQVISYGLYNADICAENVKLLKNNNFIGISFDCVEKNKKYYTEVALPGYFNVYNTLAAVGAVRSIGIDVQNHIKVLKNIRISGRAECVYASDDFDVIIDYAHNGISLKSMLDILKSYPHNRLIALFGSVGGKAQIRRKELGYVAGSECDLSIVTSDDPDFEDPQSIIDEIGKFIERVGGKYIGIVDRGEAVDYALEHMQKGDILLLAGKGHENFIKIKGEKVPFSEKEHIEHYINRHSAKH